jgi:hypothetical protein
MWRHLVQRIFGPSENSARAAARVENDRHDISTGANIARKPWRTVGLTEQRLRERNRESWITSTKGWSEMLGRFSSK